MTAKPIIMAVDANSLLHRNYHAAKSSNLHDQWNRPTWAIKGMLGQLLAAAQRIGPSAIVIGFDTPGSSVRRDRYPAYKEGRSEKDETLVSQLALAVKMLEYSGFAVSAPVGLEADDVTASAAVLAGQHGWNAVIVTSDRDAFAHISDHCRVLRVLNGGIDASPVLTPDRLLALNGVRAGSYLDYAALRGDTSDNLPGVHGIGEKTAAKLLAAFDSMDEVWADVHADGARVAEAAGKACLTRLRADGAYEAWARNVDIMKAVTDVDLGIDLSSPGTRGHLPMDPAQLEAGCAGVNMVSLIRPLIDTFGTAPAPHEETAVAPAATDDFIPAWMNDPNDPVVPVGASDWGPADNAWGPAEEETLVGAGAGTHPAAAIHLPF